MADGTAKPIKDIQEGDKVLAGDPATGEDAPEEVIGIIGKAQQANVHNLTVDDLHTYFVLTGEASILVHNDACNILSSTIHDDPLLIKAAEKAGRNQAVQRDVGAIKRNWRRVI